MGEEKDDKKKDYDEVIFHSFFLSFFHQLNLSFQTSTFPLFSYTLDRKYEIVRCVELVTDYRESITL